MLAARGQENASRDRVSVLEAMKMSVKAVSVHVIEVVRVKTEVNSWDCQ